MSTLEELLAEQDRYQDEFRAAKAAMEAAQQAVLDKRFEDWDLFRRGDLVLVKRNLFGSITWWPARVIAANLYYRETIDGDGTIKGHQSVSYSVRLWVQKDRAFASVSTGFYGSEVSKFTGDPAAYEEAS